MVVSVTPRMIWPIPIYSKSGHGSVPTFAKNDAGSLTGY